MSEPIINVSPTVLFMDESAEIEPTATGFALVHGGFRVELSELLANRLTINVLGARRRTEATT